MTLVAKKRCLIHWTIVAAFLICLCTFAPAEATANGSWGGSRGGFSSHGSWGCRGGLLAGRAPIRNLLSRLGNRLSLVGTGHYAGNLGLGSRGYHGCQGSRISYGSVGSSAIYGGYSSRISSGSWGSSYAASTPIYASPAPNFSTPTPVFSTATPIYSAPIATAPSYHSETLIGPTTAITSETSYAAPMMSDFVTESSYPVGDYGFEPGYPVSQSTDYYQPGSTLVPMESGFSSPIIDGGIISNGMIDGGMMIEGGIINGGNPSIMTAPQIQMDDPGTNNPTIPTDPGPIEEDGQTNLSAIDSDYAILELRLPVDSKVYINGRLTSTPGKVRRYVSRGLTEDRDYKYQVTAVREVNGKEIKKTQMVSLRPGNQQSFEFDLGSPTVTRLSLETPIDAKVKLCGKTMAPTGTQLRSFETTSLAEGESWDGYEIEVEFQRNGKTHRLSRQLDIVAGTDQTIRLGLNPDLQNQMAKR